jgi:hypothetical protein
LLKFLAKIFEKSLHWSQNWRIFAIWAFVYSELICENFIMTRNSWATLFRRNSFVSHK